MYAEAPCARSWGTSAMAEETATWLAWPRRIRDWGPFFDYEVGRVTQGHLPCGICRNPEEERGICPKRLLAFSSNGVVDRHRDLADRAFALCGFLPGQEVAAWSEISLKEEGEKGVTAWITCCGPRNPAPFPSSPR